jgi:hypothetical protein
MIIDAPESLSMNIGIRTLRKSTSVNAANLQDALSGMTGRVFLIWEPL